MVQATEADEARLARHAPVALLCVTPQGGVLANNSAWLDLIGADAAPHDPVLGHLSGSDAEALSHALELVGERGGRVHVRTEFGQPGRVVSWELVGEAMQGVIHATVLDRTAEERQLQGFAHTVRAIYEVSPVMLHTADADGCIEMVSDAWLRALGYAREQVVGRQFSEFLAASSRRLAESLRAEEAAGPFEDIPLRLRRSDGSELDVC